MTKQSRLVAEARDTLQRAGNPLTQAQARPAQHPALSTDTVTTVDIRDFDTQLQAITGYTCPGPIRTGDVTLTGVTDMQCGG